MIKNVCPIILKLVQTSAQGHPVLANDEEGSRSVVTILEVEHVAPYLAMTLDTEVESRTDGGVKGAIPSVLPLSNLANLHQLQHLLAPQSPICGCTICP